MYEYLKKRYHIKTKQTNKTKTVKHKDEQVDYNFTKQMGQMLFTYLIVKIMLNTMEMTNKVANKGAKLYNTDERPSGSPSGIKCAAM